MREAMGGSEVRLMVDIPLTMTMMTITSTLRMWTMMISMMMATKMMMARATAATTTNKTPAVNTLSTTGITPCVLETAARFTSPALLSSSGLGEAQQEKQAAPPRRLEGIRSRQGESIRGGLSRVIIISGCSRS
jgi:hypothetical protein